MRPPDRDPATPCQPLAELVAWLRATDLPPGPIRTARGTVVVDPGLHRAYLLAQAATAKGQHRTAVWLAIQRLHDAVEGKGDATS